MTVVTDYRQAKQLTARLKPCFYAPFDKALVARTSDADHEQIVIGRRYKGIFDDEDGSFVKIREAKRDYRLEIDRDSFGSIPVFYSENRPIVSTDLSFIVDVEQPAYDFQALAEYVSTAFLTGGKTIYKNIRWLMPTEKLSLSDKGAEIQEKEIFGEIKIFHENEAAELLEKALNNSVENILAYYPGQVLLNLSGGCDSTLLLAKIKERDQDKDVITNTYFHEDWRDDLDDWKFADQASHKFASRHFIFNLNNEVFCSGHQELLKKIRRVAHTYTAAFYVQNNAVSGIEPTTPIINGSGPDESMIGTEKVSVPELMELNKLERDRWLNTLFEKVEFIRIPEAEVATMLCQHASGFVRSRKDIAQALLDAPSFVEFQRRYHTLTMLQDHILELTCVAQALNRPIVFPYLTNDLFKIIFSSSFEALNAGAVYKSAMKKILAKVMPEDFVHRKKIGFQSPSRPYFASKAGLGRELNRLLSQGGSDLLRLGVVEPEIQSRLNMELDLHRRYDFLEWTAYNILLLEEIRRGNG
jgi:asparagine synthetase B (glutamine-hydrolysing)